MSWKKYGGIKNLENFNNMTLNNIVTDTFTVRDAIINLLRIEGDLLVNGKIDVRNDVIIRGNIMVDSIFGANLVTFDTARIREGHISENLFIKGNIFFDPARDTFIYGKNYNFGINMRTPTAALDISSIYNENINMWTTQPINKNVLSRNNQDKGIVFITDNYGASIEFFNETPIPISANNVTFQDNNYVADASMNYHKGGILELHTTNDVKISTNLIINKKSNKGHLLQEPAVIYDIPAGTYFYNSYQQSTVKTGNALTLISNDNSSNTFLNITTPNKQGAAFGGGMYPNDVSRNMAIIGVLDASGALTPHQIIVSGNSSVRAKATVGFNTFAPITETYVVNINGPTRITNGEITTIVEPHIQVYKIGYPKNKLYQNQICVVGTPYPDPTNLTNNLYYIWNSATGGTTWTQPDLKNINGSPIFGSTVNIIFYGSTVYNNNFILMSGTSDTILFSTNGGANWRIVTGISKGSTFYYVSVIYYNSTQQLFFAAYDGSFLYFYADVTNSNSFNVTSSVSISTGISGIGTSCDTAGDYFYIAGSTKIKQYQISTLSSTSQPANTPHDSPSGKYNSISAYSNNHVVAVGVNIISYSNNGGINWTDFNLTPVGVTFNSVYVYDEINAVAVGNAGKVYYTNNGSFTWQPIPYSILNASGIADRVLDSTKILSSVYMPNINTMIISSVTTQYMSGITAGGSKIFYVYVPNLFNITNTMNTVLDVCGNIALSGSMVLTGQINQF